MKTYTFLPCLLTLAGALAFGDTLSAQDHHGQDHHHTAPHGGVVVTADKYHIEMAQKGDKLSFYLLDGSEKTIPNAGVTGQAMFQFADKKTDNVAMTVKGDDRFELVLTNPSEFTVIVTFTKGDEKISARLTSGPRSAAPAPVRQSSDGHNHQH